MTEADFTSWPAPAKLNLFLHILGRRADGYHELQTLFQLLDWGDRIRIMPTDGADIRRRAVEYGVAEADDLVVRAARLLKRESGCAGGAVLEVEKNVPPGSGMGGGSSDAATVLLALNRLWACGLSLDELALLGKRLGADVPVFVRGASALASGIGEQLQPVTLGERHYVVVFPGPSVSTAEVFGHADLKRDSSPLGREEALAGGGRNDCEPVVAALVPEVARALDRLRRWGAPRMTGTGSAVFLLMTDEKSAISAAEEIKTLYNVRAVGGLDRSPVHELLIGE